jgi:plasmid stabilization system protein ParE
VKLSYTPEAIQDLVRLRAFIAEHNPQVAKRLSDQLRSSIQKLTQFPNMGVAVKLAPNPKLLRDFIRGDYVVRYLVLEDKVIILRVWQGRENRSEET